jgi:hypothetical protein
MLSTVSLVPELEGIVDVGDPTVEVGALSETVVDVEILFVPEVVEDVIEPEERESGFDPKVPMPPEEIGKPREGGMRRPVDLILDEPPVILEEG